MRHSNTATWRRSIVLAVATVAAAALMVRASPARAATCADEQTAVGGGAPPLVVVNALLDCYGDFTSVYRTQVLGLAARDTSSPLASVVMLFDSDVTLLLTTVREDVVPGVPDTDLADYAVGVTTSGLIAEAAAVEAELNGRGSRNVKARAANPLLEGLNRSLSRLVERSATADKHHAVIAGALLDVLGQITQIVGR